MSEECKNEQRITNIENTLYGNGREGVKEKVIRMQETQKVLEKNTESIDERLDRIAEMVESLAKASQENTNNMAWVMRISKWVIGTVTAVAVATVTTAIRVWFVK